MPPRESDIQAFLKKKRKEHVAEFLENSLLKSAAVQSDKLTGSPEWDRFLERLQPLLDDAKSQKAYWLGLYGDAFDELNRGMRQAKYLEYRAIEETLERVMTLPKEIVKEYHDARTGG